MIERCDICGDPGVVEAIIICSECQVSREHLYCMREFRTQAPPWWRCEECQGISPKTTDDEQKTKKVSTLLQQTTLAIDGQNKNRIPSQSNFKEKWVDKGRTKYLSCDEAVKLSSGSLKSNNSRTEFRSAHGMSKSMTPPRVFQQSTGLKEKTTTSTCERTSIKSPQEERSFKPKLQQPFVQQSFSSKGKATLPTSERAHIKSPKEERTAKPNSQQRVVQQSFSPKESAATSMCERKSPQEERSFKPNLQQPVVQQSFCPKESATLPTCEMAHIKSPEEERNVKPNWQQPVVQQSFSPKEKAFLAFQNRGNDTQSSKSSMPSRRVEGTNPEREMKIICKNEADVEAGRSDTGKPNLTSGLPVSEMHDPYIPSLHSYWKGCFYLPKGSQKFNEAFKAHLPSRVHYKVFETVKRMPESIYFELFSNHDIRTEIFAADRDDIGLYFFPRFKRRSENDISIIDFMWRNNLVMRSNVEGLELFVLSSRVLPSHAQEFEGNYFLWGVFRRPKTVKKVADAWSLMAANREPCYADVPPGSKNICKQPCYDDVPPGFKRICKR